MEGESMVKKNRKRYDSTFKEWVIQRMLRGEKVKALSMELQIGKSALFSWRQEAERRPGGKQYAKRKPGQDSEVQALEARIAELEAAVGRTTLERDFLAGALRRIGVAIPSRENAGKKTSGPRSAAGWNRKAN